MFCFVVLCFHDWMLGGCILKIKESYTESLSRLVQVEHMTIGQLIRVKNVRWKLAMFDACLHCGK